MRISLESIARSRPWVILAAGGGALGLGLVAAAYAGPITGPFEVDDGTDSFAIKGYTYTSSNATGVLGFGGNSSATNATGVAGYVTSPLSVGVTGYAASTGVNAYGVYGFSNTGNGVYGVSNSSAAASIYGYNAQSAGTGMFGYSSGGNGVLGSSGSTNGVVGLTQTTSTSDSTTYAGVLGADNSTAGYYNAGVSGSTVRGFALYGIATGPDGYGGYFTSSIDGGSAVALAIDNKEAGVFVGNSGGASYPALVAVSGTTGTDPFATVTATGQKTFIVQAGTQGSNGQPFANDVQISGNLYVEGVVYSDCYINGHETEFPVTSGPSCGFQPGENVAPERTASGSDVRAYSARQSLPTSEDFGEAELVNGQANVPLDRTFASTIDASRSYLVFITPEGDCHGLYVAARGSGGFVVRELMNGHSTLSFGYRVVAHPYRDASVRFPAIPVAKAQAAVVRSSGRLGPDPKTRALQAGAGIPQIGRMPKQLPQPAMNPAFMRPAPHVK